MDRNFRLLLIGIGLFVHSYNVPLAFAGLMSTGDLAFTAFNADDEDAFQIVALVDIDPNTMVFFSDRNWNGTSFASSEGTLKWTSGSNVIAAGSVIDFTDLTTSNPLVGSGSLAETGTFNLSGSGDQLYAFLGASGSMSPSTFLAAISNEGFSSPSLANTGLNTNSTAVGITGDEDVMEYTGFRSGESSFASYLTQIADTSNWLTQDGSGNQSMDGLGPDVPFDGSSFSITSAGVVPEPTSLAIWLVCLSGLFRRTRKPVSFAS